MAVEADLAHRWKGTLAHMLGLLAAGVLGQITTAKGSASYSVCTLRLLRAELPASQRLLCWILAHCYVMLDVLRWSQNRGQSVPVVKYIFVMLYKIDCKGRRRELCSRPAVDVKTDWPFVSRDTRVCPSTTSHRGVFFGLKKNLSLNHQHFWNYKITLEAYSLSFFFPMWPRRTDGL